MRVRLGTAPKRTHCVGFRLFGVHTYFVLLPDECVSGPCLNASVWDLGVFYLPDAWLHSFCFFCSGGRWWLKWGWGGDQGQMQFGRLQKCTLIPVECKNAGLGWLMARVGEQDPATDRESAP